MIWAVIRVALSNAVASERLVVLAGCNKFFLQETPDANKQPNKAAFSIVVLYIAIVFIVLLLKCYVNTKGE